MAKLLMKAGKYLKPEGRWEVQQDQIKMLLTVRQGDEYGVMDTASGVITWGIAMKRTDGRGTTGEKIEPADVALFG